MIPFLDMKSQFRLIEAEIRAALDEVLASSRYVLGRQLAAFEQEFAAYIGVEYAVGVGSGTDAIHLALRAVGVGPGDEVVTAANTCVPTVAGIWAAGATPVLVDVDPTTLTMAPSTLDAAMTERTKAIVPVHLYGHPCDMAAIMAIAERRGGVVVEDCAQAHGARCRGVRCGAFGKAAAFSFYPSKNLGAYGDGGAVVTDDPDVAARLARLRNYGEERRYYHAVKGFNSRLDELQAAVLRVKLRHLDEWNAARRERAAAYDRLLAGTPVTTPTVAPWAEHNYHLYVVRSPHRDALQAHLDRHGVGTLLHYPVPVHFQEAYADLGCGQGAFPESERACNEVLSLPMYAELPFDAIGRVAELVAAFQP
ncbi:MAG TPA: DegT/DnrJ/EryC1/StrS family aminotransferase [Candidatus Hydrogenedentes bacterium]|nr:DegT/DnrJ/EryC1/StrS family aminotransferase [Candidatus Hydrogenedentota bacterium]